MRIEGTLKTWNDERGFGFIEPAQGGNEIFVHIKAFEDRTKRPQVGQRLTFEIELNPEGKKRAKQVRNFRIAHVRSRRDTRAQWGTASYFAIPAFLFLYLVVGMVWRVPFWVAALYISASIASFHAYSADKSAAAGGGWRISERRLILVGLLGGWPGAIVAQQVLRHKSVKTDFRSTFWVSVAINVVAFIALNSPLLRSLVSIVYELQL